MRLIDADKLENDIVENITVKAVSRMLAITQGQPTVKAITLGWLKSKIDAILDNYPDGNEETEILCKLLYEWEKENGE